MQWVKALHMPYIYINGSKGACFNLHKARTKSVYLFAGKRFHVHGTWKRKPKQGDKGWHQKSTFKFSRKPVVFQTCWPTIFHLATKCLKLSSSKNTVYSINSTHTHKNLGTICDFFFFHNVFVCQTCKCTFFWEFSCMDAGGYHAGGLNPALKKCYLKFPFFKKKNKISIKISLKTDSISTASICGLHFSNPRFDALLCRLINFFSYTWSWCSQLFTWFYSYSCHNQLFRFTRVGNCTHGLVIWRKLSFEKKKNVMCDRQSTLLTSLFLWHL